MIKRADIILIAALLLAVAILSFVFFRSDGEILTVEVNGAVVDQISVSSLEKTEYRKYETEYGSVTVGMEKNAAWIEHSDCPNHSCVKSGRITKAGQSILCLPLRVSLRFSGGPPETDGITG